MGNKAPCEFKACGRDHQVVVQSKTDGALRIFSCYPCAEKYSGSFAMIHAPGIPNERLVMSTDRPAARTREERPTPDWWAHKFQTFLTLFVITFFIIGSWEFWGRIWGNWGESSQSTPEATPQTPPPIWEGEVKEVKILRHHQAWGTDYREIRFSFVDGVSCLAHVYDNEPTPGPGVKIRVNHDQTVTILSSK